MSKRLLLAAALPILGFLSFSDHAGAQNSKSLFELPDSVCVGTYITPSDIVEGAKSYSWSFCTPDLFAKPDGENTGPVQDLSNATGIILLRQDSTSFTYHLNDNGQLVRSDYAQGLENPPAATATVGQVSNPTGLYAVQDDDNHYHIFVISGTNASDSRLTRFDFNNGIQTAPTNMQDLGVFSQFNGPKQLFIAKDRTTWYGFTFDKNDELVKITFGNNILATPATTVLGNIDNRFSGVSGLAGIEKAGNWHLFITNRTSSTVDRITFGNSLNNIPFVVNLGNFNQSIERPVGIAITKGCEAYYGYVVNYGTNSLVTLKWDAEAIVNPPVYTNHGNLAGISQPTLLSGVQEEKSTLFLLGVNVDNSISKMMLRPCTNANIAYSDEPNPPSLVYDEPGIYTVYLTINQGLPSVESYCRHILIVAHPPITLSNDTLICEGDRIRLRALSLEPDSIVWTPDYRIDTLQGPRVYVQPVYSTTYNVTTYFAPNCIIPDTIDVAVSNIKADAGQDRTIKDGSTTVLGGPETSIGGQYAYSWTPDIGITGSTGAPVTEARPPYDISYYLTVTNDDGCEAIDTVNVKVPCDDIHLPNAFIPGSANGKVSKFGLLNQQFVKINYFKIYNRWGQEVFSTTNPSGKWDGTFDGQDAPMGVYVWEVDANCINTAERYRKTGTVTLIR